MRREARPILCYVTDRRGLSTAAQNATEGLTDAVLGVIRRAVAAGIDWVQVREKDMPARELVRLGRAAVAAALAPSPRPPGSPPIWPTRILINDRLDVALAAGAAGVHLGEESLPVAAVVRWCRAGQAPAGLLVGASCHSLTAAREAERGGADYLFFGPVFATPSKAAYGPPQGLERLGEMCQAVRIPVLAIGGITLENAAACLAAGAAGLAAIRLFQQAADLAGVMARLRSAP